MKFNIFKKQYRTGLKNFRNESPHLNGQNRLIFLVHHKEQIAYFKHELSLIGLDIRTVWNYSKGVIKDKEASALTITIDSFFYTINDLVNYFIVHHTDNLQPKTRMIIKDGSLDEKYFTLHYFDKEKASTIIPFSFSTMGSSKLFEIENFTKKPESHQPLIFCGKKLTIEKNDISAMDEFLLERMKEFIPLWKEMMENIHKFTP